MLGQQLTVPSRERCGHRVTVPGRLLYRILKFLQVGDHVTIRPENDEIVPAFSRHLGDQLGCVSRPHVDVDLQAALFRLLSHTRGERAEEQVLFALDLVHFPDRCGVRGQRAFDSESRDARVGERCEVEGLRERAVGAFAAVDRDEDLVEGHQRDAPA